MAKQSIKKPIKRHFLFNPLKRPLPYIGLVIAIVIIIFQSSIRQYTANLVGDWLVSNIREVTQGNYKLEYDFVRFDIFTQELRIQNLNLALDTAVIDEVSYLEQYSNLISLSTPIVVLKLASLWDLIFSGKLGIAYIGIQEPDIRLIRSENLTKAEIEINQQATSDSLRSYLQELEIDSFRVLNGTISVDFQDEHQQNLLDFKIRNYTTLLKGFHVDHIDKSKLFQGIYAEEFELEILDQEISIPALQHKISFERLWISSNESLVQIDTLEIRPLAGTDSVLMAHIDLNRFELSGLDFRKAHTEEILDVENLIIDEPKIGLTISGLSKSSNQSLSEWRSLLFRKISIDQTNIVNGTINYNQTQKLNLNNLNLLINNYAIDSSYANLEMLTEHLTDFDLTIDGSTIELPDSIHQLNYDELKLSSKDSTLRVYNLLLSPITGRRSYKLYKERGVRIVNYGTIRESLLTGINFEQLINNQQLLADSLIVIAPRFSTTEYPYIKSSSKSGQQEPFLINSIMVTNGSMKYNKPQGGIDHRTQFNGLNLQIKKIFNGTQKGVEYEDLQFYIKDGFTEVKQAGHSLSFTNLRSDNLINFDISSLKYEPDSSSLKDNTINLKANGIRIRGFNQNAISKKKSLNIDLIAIDKIDVKGEFGRNQGSSEGRQKSFLEDIKINKLFFADADVALRNKGDVLNFTNVKTNIDSLEYQFSDSSAFIPIKFDDLRLSFSQFEVKSSKSNFNISGDEGQYIDRDSVLQFTNLHVNSGSSLTGNLNEVILNGLDRNSFTNKKAIKFNYLLLAGAKINISPTGKRNSGRVVNTDSLKKEILSKVNSIMFDSIIAENASLTISSDKRSSQVSNINTFIGEYKFDSLSEARDLFTPKKISIHVGEISTIGSRDSVSVKNITLDMVSNRLLTGDISVLVKLDSGQVKADLPGLFVSGFSTTKLLNNDFTIDTIRMSNGVIALIVPPIKEDEDENFRSVNKDLNGLISGLFEKRSNLMLDSLFHAKNKLFEDEMNRADSNKIININKLLKDFNNDNVAISADSSSKKKLANLATSTNGVIKHISLSNTSLSVKEINNPITLLNKLNFQISLDHLVLDTINEFNVFNHINDINLRLTKYTYNLPDSLNSITFDKIQISTKKEQVKIDGFEVLPRVSKYDYANIVGEQVTWQHVHDVDISIEKFNFFELINNKIIMANKIATTNGTIDIFKEKVQEIPVNRRKSMPQDALKNIKIPVLIDSVDVTNFNVNFTTRKNPDKPEGSINFHDINALVTNIVNTDSAITMNPYIILRATTKVMGKGLLSTNFNFDMNDENNGFIFDAKLDEMSAREFNSILEAMASVSIESGNIKSIRLSAEGNNDYATGNMRFEYNNLKVSTINKKTLKTTGMGKVIKTFFANAFVVKKNNPTFKIFPRDGAMYYERDPQKIIIDYVAKTAISGLISSIGARDARKDIKKIQKESKKQKDEERKALKKRRGSVD